MEADARAALDAETVAQVVGERLLLTDRRPLTHEREGSQRERHVDVVVPIDVEAHRQREPAAERRAESDERSVVDVRADREVETGRGGEEHLHPEAWPTEPSTEHDLAVADRAPTEDRQVVRGRSRLSRGR